MFFELHYICQKKKKKILITIIFNFILSDETYISTLSFRKLDRFKEKHCRTFSIFELFNYAIGD
jgi:hypothetical protein